jgi:DNA-directed RNA polymerase specialized sigma24 family protein
MTVAEWLESPYLQRVASRVGYRYGVPSQEIPDLLQELRLGMWKAGADSTVNVTWVFHTANHKAIDYVKRKLRHQQNALPSAETRLPSGGDPGLLPLLRACVALLPRSLRDFYVLRYEQGLSQREIAQRLGMCRGSIRCLDRRCLRMLLKGRDTA